MASRIKDVGEFLRKCREEYASDYLRDSIDREEAMADNAFANATDASKSQWKPDALKQREAANLPVLQWNRVPTYVQHVANAGRQNKPQIKAAAGDNGTPETAEFFQSRIRQIEYETDADIVYDTMRDQQVVSGRAFCRITTDWKPGTMNQVIRLERIEDQFSVVFGPCHKYDCSDAPRCWIVSRITKAEHIRRYGAESVLSRTDFASTPETADWIGVGEKGELFQIAEKFEKEYTKRTIVRLKTGVDVDRAALTDEQFESLVLRDPDTNEPSTREEDVVKVCRYVINGVEVLEEGEWITDDIPVVPQWGREAVDNGIQRRYSLINAAKDPQRLVNLYVSNIAFQIAKQSKTRWKVPIGMIPQHLEDAWAGNSPLGLAYFQRYDEQGRDLGQPIPDTSEPPIEALSVGLQQALEGMKASMGIYDASMGQRSNETSGIAISRRKVEGETTNYHFADNESRTRKCIGRIFVKLISKLDKSGMTVTVRHEDGKTEQVPIGTPYQHPRTGNTVVHDLTDADVGIEVEQGPSYTSAREEAKDGQAEMMKVLPPDVALVIAPQVIRNSDWPQAQETADQVERYLRMKIPGIIEDKQDGPPISPQVQQQMMMLQQKLQQTQQFAQSLHEQIQSKQPELTVQVKLKEMELDFKREELAEKSRVELAKLGIQTDIVRLENEIEILKHQAGLVADGAEAAAGRAHASDQAQAGRDHEAEQQQAALQAQQQQMAAQQPEQST